MSAKPTVDHAAPALVALGGILAAGNWYLQPERPGAWASAMFLTGCMGLALFLVPRGAHDAARRGGGDSIRRAVVFAGLMLVMVLGLKLVTAAGLMVDADVSRRATMIVTAAFFVFTGNAMPKTLTPLASLQCDGAKIQAFQRFAGRTWVLSGLAFGIAWMVLPIALAKPVSVVLLMIGMLLVAGQMVRLRLGRRRQA